MNSLVSAFLFVVLAEMGDKTQLLAMAFAARYAPLKVLLGVTAATLLNHGLAVFFGRFLVSIVPLDAITFIAAISFIIFGLWTLKGDHLDDKAGKSSRFGPVMTVAIAFFLAEMGDKTQLATISLAIQYKDWASVLLGTTLGMVVADAIGIGVGVVLHKRIPYRMVKWISASVFIIFGLINAKSVLFGRLGMTEALGAIFVIAALSAFGVFRIVRRSGVPSGDGGR